MIGGKIPACKNNDYNHNNEHGDGDGGGGGGGALSVGSPFQKVGRIVIDAITMVVIIIAVMC